MEVPQGDGNWVRFWELGQISKIRLNILNQIRSNTFSPQFAGSLGAMLQGAAGKTKTLTAAEAMRGLNGFGSKSGTSWNLILSHDMIFCPSFLSFERPFWGTLHKFRQIIIGTPPFVGHLRQVSPWVFHIYVNYSYAQRQRNLGSSPFRQAAPDSH